MDAWPNQEALNKALNIYRASMRSFIISHLKKSWGPDVEDVIIDSVDDWRANEIDQSLSESGRDIEFVIDINDFPHLVNRNWGEAFERILNYDKTFRNQLWLIVECRNTNSHPPEDPESESTRAHLFLIADVLGKIKRPDKKREVEIIRENLFADNTEKRLADTEEHLKEVEAENAEYKKLLTAITANTLEERVEIRRNTTEIHNALSTIAERFLARTTLEERVEIGRKVAALRINAEGAKGMAWWKIRAELRRTERLHLKQEDLREVIRREDHFKESIVERIESFEGGWECQVDLTVLCGFEPIGEWLDRIEVCKPIFEFKPVGELTNRKEVCKPKSAPKEEVKSEAPPFTVPQILAIRQWFNKRNIEHLGSSLGLSASEVRDAIKDPEYIETIANLMRTTRSPAILKKWIETYPRSEMPTEIAERFGVSEAVISEIIEEVEDWLTSRA